MKLDEDKSSEDKADKKDIVVELNGIEDRIVRLSSQLFRFRQCHTSQKTENLYYF